ncbi:hypothetical protein BWQ96_05405 [Gracilariopsis chorda]|uniref:Uncharacterized protein n=1 Tax=Gracilariopsis chorda TaxID=448386 RepID=A0A2V3IRS2_9FLOR|nr:hypothetical protein BWQ96_05405 [Gracilariopsis chorda]|eukprot:PXF44822.1 hypothetical protein BWQ96_05405 [Gracilariopsis chorda]
MASMFGYVSVPAFIVSSLVKFIVTTVWYSKPVFGTWAKRLAFGKRRRPKPSLQHLAVSVIGSIVSFSFFSTVLHVAKCQTPLDGALWGLALGLFFDSGMNASHCFFENRSFSLFLLHNGCHAVSLTTAGIVLALLCGSPSA